MSKALMSNALPPVLTCKPTTYRARRKRLAAELRRPMLIMAGRERSRNYPANVYPFRAGSSYLYFGGPSIPGAALMIEPGSDGDSGSHLLRPERPWDEIVWMGEAPADSAYAAVAGVSETRVVATDRLSGLIGGRSVSLICPPCAASREAAASIGAVNASPDEILVIVELRLIKDAEELVAMRRAASVSAAAHVAAMRVTRPGRSAAYVASVLFQTFTANGCDVSFTPIVTVQGEILHREGYDGVLDDGRLLLVDAGAEERGGYAGDVTRTYPVNGRFSPTQRDLYEVVLRAQRAAIDACVAGARFRDVHDLSARVVCEGLVAVGLLRGNADDLAVRGAHALFYVHGLGHLLGLDVHDMEDFGDLAGYTPGRARRTGFGHKFLRFDRDLQPGMTFTVEPGVYLIPAVWANQALIGPFADVVNRRAVDALLAESFGGIRIEDDVVVRDSSNGPEVLTAEAPKDVDAVERLIGKE